MPGAYAALGARLGLRGCSPVGGCAAGRRARPLVGRLPGRGRSTAPSCARRWRRSPTDPAGARSARSRCYAARLRAAAWAWCRVLPGLPFGQSWAALHVSLLGNHVLPFRLGEALRVTSVLRRTAAAGGAGDRLRRRRCGRPTCSPCSLLAAGGRARGWPAGCRRLGAGRWPPSLLAAGVAAVGWLVVLRRRGAAVRLPGARGGAAPPRSPGLLEAAVVLGRSRPRPGSG